MDAPINPERLRKLQAMRSKGLPVFPELAALFLQNAHATLQEIRLQYKDADAKPLKASLHKLKGSCAMLGTTVMISILEDMEMQAENGEGGGLASRIMLLETALQDVEKFLTETADPN